MFENSLNLSESTIGAVSAVLECASDSFSEIVSVANLDKKRDFQHVNLTGIDFSNSDLRGFNFTGSNLSNSYGVNVLYDESTILDGAIVSNSILHQESERRAYFAQNPEHLQLYVRLRDDYWASGALWIGQNLKRSSKNFETASQIAKFLYPNVHDQTYKNQILYGINSIFDYNEEYKTFLVTQLSLPGNSNRTIRALVDILGRAFGRDSLVREMLLLYSDHPLAEVRRVCIPAVMSRRFFFANAERIIRNVMSEPDKICRKLYTRHFSKLAGPQCEALLLREDEGSFHDYAQSIDDGRFQTLVVAAIRRLKSARRVERIRGAPVTPTVVTHSEFLRGVHFYNAAFQRIQKLGLPLRLEYPLDRYYRELKTFNRRREEPEAETEVS